MSQRHNTAQLQIQVYISGKRVYVQLLETNTTKTELDSDFFSFFFLIVVALCYTIQYINISFNP